MLGVTGASTLFALALLASGQNSTLTGTLAGQIVMEGFLNIRLRPWLRRLITRGIAIIPAIIVTGISGEHGTTNLLVLSQVVLSLQLSFAVFPLVMFTSNKVKMGEFVNSAVTKSLAWCVAVVIAVLNVWLLVQTFRDWLRLIMYQTILVPVENRETDQHYSEARAFAGAPGEVAAHAGSRGGRMGRAKLRAIETAGERRDEAGPRVSRKSRART